MTRLAVSVSGQRVGSLSVRGKQDIIELRVERAFCDAVPQPVLGQWYVGRVARPVTFSTRQRLPPWFANLLPEGALRELISRREGVHPDREFFLLRALGGDLPGAVVVEPETDTEDEGPTASPVADEGAPPGRALKFSLAGVQLKFSVVRGERLTLPVSGRGGDWIVKLPDERFDGVPENEWSTMHWARAAGISVPEFDLVPVGQIDGLPPEVEAAHEAWAFACKRFDRDEGRRVHFEDFAQVLGVYPDRKYDRANYETIGRILRYVAPEEAFEEFVRRLVFMLACGNEDGHLKNWALCYPDGVRADLAPAYDMVFTLAYTKETGLAMKLGKTRDVRRIGWEAFARLGRKADADPERTVRTAREAADAIRQAFTEVRPELRLPATTLDSIAKRWQQVPILRSRSA